MKRVIKLTALITAVMTLACGCMALYENNDIGDIPPINVEQEVYAEKNRIIDPTLYFYNPDTGELATEVHNVSVSLRGNVIESVIEEVLKGSRVTKLVNGASAILSDAEVLDGLVNVYLRCNSTVTDKERYILACQIADTVIDYLGVEFVCVFYNGKFLSIDGYPVGALKKSDGRTNKNYEDILMSYERAQVGYDKELNIALYFIDNTARHFIPEVRTLTVRGGFSSKEELYDKLMHKALTEISKGPQTKYYLLSYINSSYLEEDSYSVKYSDGEINLKIDENNGIFYYRSIAERAACFYTLQQLVPYLGNLKVTQVVSTQVFKTNRLKAARSAGKMISLYLPEKNLNKLYRKKIIISQADTGKPEAILRELCLSLNQTKLFENRIAFKFTYINNVVLSGDTIVLDFTENFEKDMAVLDDKTKKLVLYSFINTLTDAFLIDQVLIRVNGEVPTSLGENIDLTYPLFANYGAVSAAG